MLSRTTESAVEERGRAEEAREVQGGRGGGQGDAEVQHVQAGQSVEGWVVLPRRHNMLPDERCHYNNRVCT